MIGRTLGSYRIEKTIGEGGMGVVYKGVHTLLGRTAAIKALLPELSHSRDLVERFFLEARTAATIHHPGIVDVLDFGHDPSGTAYLVMELLDGESLAARLERERRLPVDVALAITRQLASALHAAHEKGIVHRDLKPENLFLIADPEVPTGTRTKVLDFGIAKLTRSGESTVKTKTGMVIGTPRYMSPEQCRDSAAVDRRADIYALGCILYEMILGQRVFMYDTYNELVAAHLHEQPNRPRQIDPSLPPNIEQLILRAIAKRAEDRYPSMIALAHDVEHAWRMVAGVGSGVRFTPMPAFDPLDDEPTSLAQPKPEWTKPPTIAETPRGRGGSTPPIAAEVANRTAARRRTWLPVSIAAVVAIAVGVVVAIASGSSSATEHADDHASATGSAPAVVATAPPPNVAPVTAAPAAPATVKLVVDSIPQGADVYRVADGVKIGKTPFEHAYERTEGEAEFVIKLAGYADARTSLSTLRDGSYVAHLVRDKKPVVAHHAPPAKHSDAKAPDKTEAKTTSGGLLDPYGGK